jgi:hypothetical protein
VYTMVSQEDNVVHIPTSLDRLAARAVQAMANYKTGHSAAIKATIAYGAALNEGRALHASNKAFAQWVADQGLDQGSPWDSRTERGAAMLVALRLRENPLSEETLMTCTRSRPNDIRDWLTKQQGQPPPKRRDFTKRKRAEIELNAMKAAGIAVTAAELARRAEVGETTAYNVIQTLSEAAPPPPPPPAPETVDLARFPERSRMTIEKAVAIYKKQLDKAFETRVYDEVRRRIDRADDAVRNSLKELRAKCDRLERMVQQKGVFTRLEFRQLQMAVHPDNTASAEVRNRLLDLLVKNEARLVKEA